MQEPIIKKKPKQEPSPFSKNIQAYIFANNLNRQDFADLINAYMAAYPDRGKIYSNNDVWTYERRGSLPKDMRAGGDRKNYGQTARRGTHNRDPRRAIRPAEAAAAASGFGAD